MTCPFVRTMSLCLIRPFELLEFVVPDKFAGIVSDKVPDRLAGTVSDKLAAIAPPELAAIAPPDKLSVTVAAAGRPNVH